ncbi:hypothetical protein HMPREF1221_01856 [Treponema socranskii subsp. paredis ATCC 35535]|nr:hypothetical protein HMPREF1221_01856 [Treponema socranskii subsp. paredis ATCC 35535]
MPGSSASARGDTLSSVQLYMDTGEYDRALDLLEKLLKKNPGDAEARRLLDELHALKSAKSGDGAMQDELARSTAEAQRTQKELEELIARGQNSPLSQNTASGSAQRPGERTASAETSADKNAAQQKLREAEEAARRAREAEIAAEKAAAAAAARERKAEAEKAAQALAAQKQREAAARKAAEEELARKNRAIQREIDGVNGEIAQGKSDLTANKIDSALNHFGKAQKMLPISAGEPLFSGSKNSEMAAALYEASQNAASDADRKKLRDAAVSYAEEAIRKTPNDAAAHYVLGMTAMDAKNYPKALDELSKAVQNDQSNALYHYNLGRVQYLSRRYSDARSSFQRSVDLDGRFAPAQYNLGLANLRTGNESEALSSFRRARTTDANYEKAYLEEARLLSKQGDQNGAVKAYNAVLRINDVNGNALRELGSEYYAMENYAASENCYRRALALLSPTEEDPTTYYNLSATLYAERKDAEAVAYAKRAYASKASLGNTAQANVVYNYALMLQDSGKFEEAIPLYLEALRLNPNHEKSKINLGKMYLEMNPPDVDTALRLFKQAYDADNKSFEANNNLGSAYLAKKDYKNAIKFYQNALRLDPSNNTVRSNLAQTYASDGQFDNAKTTYTELIKRDGTNWDAYVELGKVCMSTGDTAGAERYLSEVQTKRPNHRRTEVTELLSALRSGGIQAK